MFKKILWIVFMAALFLGTAAASAEQNGNSCWCNIDQYGCRVTDEDGATSYIMFWSEEARQYIMGTNSAPYKLVVTHPGITGSFPLVCGTEQRISIKIPNKKEDDQCKAQLSNCQADCERADCLPEKNCIDTEVCFDYCDEAYQSCIAAVGD